LQSINGREQRNMTDSHTEFHKDMRSLDQAEVFARQEQRAHLLTGWLTALQLQPGDHVLDLGSGPGFMSLQLATQVGPNGLIYAIDNGAAAISYIQHLTRERQITNIQTIQADIATFQVNDPQIRAALLTMVLHHTDDAAAILQHLRATLPPQTTIVIAEFHPDGPAESGPPREHRISPEQLQIWCDAAGLRFLHYERQSEEHYMISVTCPAA
jgi:ubiquinone/menaquinone biosynthesis C-methylase UbiE